MPLRSAGARTIRQMCAIGRDSSPAFATSAGTTIGGATAGGSVLTGLTPLRLRRGSLLTGQQSAVGSSAGASSGRATSSPFQPNLPTQDQLDR